MYVCICNAVTEKQVRDAIKDGAKSMRELRQQLGVAETCGRCATCARGILKECSQCPNRVNLVEYNAVFFDFYRNKPTSTEA